MKSKGFSLIELLIAIAILGIISVIASYSWRHYVANSNLRSAARKVVADIERYKGKAVAENRNYTVTFNIAGNAYNITAPATTDLLPVNIIVKPLTAAMTDADAYLTNANNIIFTPRGLLLPYVSAAITLNNSLLPVHSTATINVSPNGRSYVTFALQ